MQTTVRSIISKHATISTDMIAHCEALQTKCSPAVFHEVRHFIHELNSRLHLQLICNKNRKLIHLGCHGFGVLNNPAGMNADIPDASGPPNDDTTMKVVVSILSDMHLTEAETSVLLKGLTFVPLNAKSDKFQAKSDCAQFFHRLRLEAHFHGRESVSDTSEDDPFNKIIQTQSLFLDTPRRSIFLS